MFPFNVRRKEFSTTEAMRHTVRLEHQQHIARVNENFEHLLVLMDETLKELNVGGLTELQWRLNPPGHGDHSSSTQETDE